MTKGAEKACIKIREYIDGILPISNNNNDSNEIKKWKNFIISEYIPNLDYIHRETCDKYNDEIEVLPEIISKTIYESNNLTNDIQNITIPQFLNSFLYEYKKY